MMHGDRSRDPPPYHPGWGGLARKLVLEERTIYLDGAVVRDASDPSLNYILCPSLPRKRCNSDLQTDSVRPRTVTRLAVLNTPRHYATTALHT